MKLTESTLKQLIREELEASLEEQEQIDANSVMDQIIVNQRTIIELLKDVRQHQTGTRPEE